METSFLSYIMAAENNHMEKRHGSPHIINKPFAFLTMFKSYFTGSHEELWGKEWWSWQGEGGKRSVSKRKAYGGFIPSKLQQITTCQSIRSRWAQESSTLEINESITGKKVGLKKQAQSFSFLLICTEKVRWDGCWKCNDDGWWWWGKKWCRIVFVALLIRFLITPPPISSEKV